MNILIKEYGVLKGLLLLLIYVLIGIVLAMILAGLPTAGPEGEEG